MYKRQVDNHINLAGALLNGVSCLSCLCFARHGSERESDNTAGCYAAAGELLGNIGNISGVYTYACAVILLGLVADGFNLLDGRICFQQRIIQIFRHACRREISVVRACSTTGCADLLQDFLNSLLND